MNDNTLLHAKLNLETAPIAWKELLRFFATGVVFRVADQTDMVDVAVLITNDERAAVEALLNSGQLARVSDEDALRWFESDATVWSVVVKPWILVQETPPVRAQNTVQ
ncbi:MAG: DUF2288 domain-containing protein [Formosimonas sp.]